MAEHDELKNFMLAMTTQMANIESKLADSNSQILRMESTLTISIREVTGRLDAGLQQLQEGWQKHEKSLIDLRELLNKLEARVGGIESGAISSASTAGPASNASSDIGDSSQSGRRVRRRAESSEPDHRMTAARDPTAHNPCRVWVSGYKRGMLQRFLLMEGKRLISAVLPTGFREQTAVRAGNMRANFSITLESPWGANQFLANFGTLDIVYADKLTGETHTLNPRAGRSPENRQIGKLLSYFFSKVQFHMVQAKIWKDSHSLHKTGMRGQLVLVDNATEATATLFTAKIDGGDINIVANLMSCASILITPEIAEQYITSAKDAFMASRG